ncbi:MAG TPA: hypothetical protein VK451_02115 [Methyloceanibacter sp.]|nr:hypothetical protein [Methyloceanibacter sp.]
MRNFLISGLLIVGVATPALAAQQHFVVQDSSGYCAVIDAHPSKVSRLKTVGKASGYNSHDAAEQALKTLHNCTSAA